MDSINNTQAASGATGSGMSGALTGGQTMGRDAFLKLLVAQLRHQDPLKPQDGSEFVAELAQFSSLEQTIAINDRLDMLALQNRGLANTQVASLVGQTATVRGTMVTSDGTGVGSPVNFSLGGAADKVTVTICQGDVGRAQRRRRGAARWRVPGRRQREGRRRWSGRCGARDQRQGDRGLVRQGIPRAAPRHRGERAGLGSVEDRTGQFDTMMTTGLSPVLRTQRT